MNKITPAKPVKHTKELILAIAKDHGMNEKVFKEEIKKHGCAGPFDEKKWKRYYQIICGWEFFNQTYKSTMHMACPVCGAKQIQDPTLVRVRLMAYTWMRCEANKHHYYIVLEAARQASHGVRLFEEALKLQIEKEKVVNEVPVMRN
jgi:hypothetical protein